MSSRPNIVVILADDLGFSALGCYGSEIRQGPRKLVSGEEERWELYQIDEDHTESTDLAGHEKQRVSRMAGEWNDWAVRVGVNFDLREDLQRLFALERRGVEEGRARLRRASVGPCG